MRTIGFLGTGNMSSAIVNGIMASGLLAAQEITLFNRTKSKAEALAERYEGMRAVSSEAEVLEACKYIVLGMKPHQYESVIQGLKPLIKPHHVIVTIAAGIDIDKVHYWFSDDVKVARTMPNTPAQVQQGMTAVTFSSRVTEEEQQYVLALMRAFGLAEVIEEKLMDAVPAVSGSAPAYFFMVIEAMADEAVRQGFSRPQAYRMAAQAMVGAGTMVLETGLHPGVLKDQVTSPGGTTIEAVKTLEEAGMRAAFMKAMAACTDKVVAMKKNMG